MTASWQHLPRRVRQSLMYRRDLLAAALAHRIDVWRAPTIDPAQTLVVTGFWRSGTTWLMQAAAAQLGAKTVFEPLDAEAYQPLDLSPYPQLNGKSRAYLETYMPYSAVTLSPALAAYLRGALHSTLAGRWVRYGRDSVTEAWRQQVVVKLVRGQLLLPALHETFGVRLLHIQRDPRAVLASILRNDWGRWLYELSLVGLLLAPDDGRESFFGQWRAVIHEYETADVVTRITAYWALTELAVQQMTRQVPVQMLMYEEFGQAPDVILPQALAALGYESIAESNLQAASPTTFHERGALSFQQKMTSWQRELSAAHIQQIETVVQRLGLASRLVG